MKGYNYSMKKCVLWGANKEYNEAYNLIQYEILKGNISVECIVSRDQYSRYMDGYKVIDSSHLMDYEFDYIIVFNDLRFEEIKKEAISLGVREKQIINGKYMHLPCFDFERYTSLIENPVTIVSDDCWGRELYHYLGLESTSPFILIRIDKDDYLKICNDLKKYMSYELVMEQETDYINDRYPIGSLGEGDEKVYLNFVHDTSFKNAYDAWEKRKKRMNYDNLFVKMTILNDDQFDKFKSIPYEHKVGFCVKEASFHDNIVCPERYIWEKTSSTVFLATDFLSYIRNPQFVVYSIDFLKLLCGEEDYLRY